MKKKRYDVTIKVEWSGEIVAESEEQAKELAVARVSEGGSDDDEFTVWGVEDDGDGE